MAAALQAAPSAAAAGGTQIAAQRSSVLKAAAMGVANAATVIEEPTAVDKKSLAKALRYHWVLGLISDLVLGFGFVWLVRALG